MPLLPSVVNSVTSALAAERAAPLASGRRREVYLAICWWGKAGRTDDELFSALPHLSPNTIRPRRVELAALGLIARAGIRRPTRSGYLAEVWVDARLLEKQLSLEVAP